MNKEILKSAKHEVFIPSLKQAVAIKKKRVFLGSSNACDVQVKARGVSAIHAVLEYVSGNQFKVYDMNSTNGTYVNGEKVVVKDVGIGDKIYLANFEVQLKNFADEDALPPILDMLNEPAGTLPRVPQSVEKFSTGKKKLFDVDQEGNTHIAYPLAKDPKAEFSEYIFEDVDNLYPVISHDYTQKSVEVIILFQDRIYSVDYLQMKNKNTYHLTGSNPGSNDVEFCYLGKKDKYPFIDVQGDMAMVNPLFGFEATRIADDSPKSLKTAGSIPLADDDILCFQNGELKIFVRISDAPPKVKTAPIFRRDKDMRKYLILCLLFIFLFIGLMFGYTVDEKLEEEKAPERIATILYKKPVITKAISKSPLEKKKQIQKTEPKKAVEKPKKETPKEMAKKIETPRKQDVKAPVKVGDKTSTNTKTPRKATPRVAKKVVEKPYVKPPSRRKAPGAAAAAKAATRTSNDTKAKGNVDVYKSADFSGTISRLMSKGGSTKSVQAAKDSISDFGASSLAGGGDSATVTRAKVSAQVGSLTGAASGTLDTQKGVDGLVSKKSIYTVGIPSRTVVLGGMDPDIIRKILNDHIPQFRYCYQQVLDKSSREFSGIVKLNFIIGASGHVTRAGVVDSDLPGGVKGCVVNVLRGIVFPAPVGGTKVEVNQPMNFYPTVK